MELVCRSFRLERGSSIKLGRSNSSLLVSESISSECAKIAGYERLSASMRMSSEQDIRYRSRKSRAFMFISKVFSFRKISGDCETKQQANMVTQEEKKRKKNRSSWLPDPGRRWPVQGWQNTYECNEKRLAIKLPAAPRKSSPLQLKSMDSALSFTVTLNCICLQGLKADLRDPDTAIKPQFLRRIPSIQLTIRALNYRNWKKETNRMHSQCNTASVHPGIRVAEEILHTVHPKKRSLFC
ncbi:unnamed protein product [Dovyalis caffra]|uniref:Uncharacterized protein n=1 Tax=Dovyalis caffra TaxID=77055 RepID=A0AAV1RUV0_9ROSI|nr:unnamed protein product [Dovyalis caffra]